MSSTKLLTQQIIQDNILENTKNFKYYYLKWQNLLNLWLLNMCKVITTAHSPLKLKWNT